MGKSSLALGSVLEAAWRNISLLHTAHFGHVTSSRSQPDARMHTHDYNFPIVQASAVRLVQWPGLKITWPKPVHAIGRMREEAVTFAPLLGVDWRLDVGCTLRSGVHTHAFVRVSCCVCVSVLETRTQAALTYFFIRRLFQRFCAESR